MIARSDTMANHRALVRPKIGLVLPQFEGRFDGGPEPPALRWSELQTMARAAEDAGLDSLWLIDSLLAEGDPPKGYWEGWSLLTAVAAVTRRVEIGHLVTANTFRNPALLAKMADTVDEISGGRLILGLGAGDGAYSHQTFGFPWERRVARFEEALQIIVPLLRESRVDFQGEFYTMRECELRPRGPRAFGPPILIGSTVNAPRMLRLTAQYADMWHGLLAFGRSTPDQLPPLRDALDAACLKVGRDPATLARTVVVRVELDGPIGHMFDSEEPIRGSMDEVAETFWGFADEGITHLMLCLSPESHAAIEQVGRVIQLMDRGRPA
jgi:alkanesulfonate monooxygenase SsuD/methylene tetrahydromethanopterin reductase-like flavin-dependent oxidoreductase (luciferase family)